MYRLILIAAFWVILAAPAHAATQTVTVTAKQFSFSPSTITVNEGDTVKLTLVSSDVDHGFSLSAFGVNANIPAGGKTTVTFEADTAGTYSFSCSVFCGSGHGGMTGTLVVKEAPAPDTTAPAVSGVRISSFTDTNAVISWSTDEAAFGQVEYGTASGAYTEVTPLEETASTAHTASLSNLSAGTTYYFRVKVQDSAGNVTRGSESSLTTEEEDDTNSNRNTNTKTNDNKNNNENTNSADDDEPSGDGASIATIGGEDQTFTLASNPSSIAFTVGEQLRLTGTASAHAEVIIEFCCSVTRYTVVADSDGEWAFQGTPSLDSGDQTVTVYERDRADEKDVVEFVMSEESDATDSNEASDDETEDVGGGGFDNAVVWIIIVGILLMIGAGAFFARSMRR